MRILILAACAPFVLTAFQSATPGEYQQLLPAQKRLLEKWVAEFNQLTGQKRTPEELYESAPVSSRTTFEAVTHALNRSTLTSADGASLGTALDIVDRMETVRGQIQGAGGDEQFRMYATLKPGAVAILEKSREFGRGPDNTVFHRGYPICYRQTGGVPSIQLSISLDEKRCDIDVDYRSSKFPAGLVNGHLSSSNSDVRAGKNHQRHTSRWEGLQNWWAAWFGGGLLRADEAEAGGKVVTEQPKFAKGKLSEALNEFFHSWLIEKKPGLAVSYFSPRSFSCEVGMHADEEGPPLNRGLVPIRILKNLHAANKSYPDLKSIDEFVETVPIELPALRAAEAQSDARFKVYQVRDDLAEKFECDYKYGFAEAPGAKEKFGDTYGVAVRFKPPKSAAQLFYFAWRKEKEGWRIVSYDSEASMVKRDLPDLRAKASAPKPETYKGDPALVQAAQSFMQNLLVKRKAAEAMKNFSPRSTACYGYYAQTEVDTSIPEAEKLKRIGAGFESGIAKLSRRPALADYTQAVTPWDDYARLVAHKDEAAFGIFALPDAVGEAADCAHRAKGARMDLKRPIEPKYGNYYASVFRFKVPGEEPAVLFLLWTKDAGAWKVISYHVETP